MLYYTSREYHDDMWVDQAFFHRQGSGRSKLSGNANTFSPKANGSASLKFWDTSFGGHRCINAPYGFTETADIVTPPVGRITAGAIAGTYGLGEYYSMAIDDNLQTVSLQWGTPRFNSLGNFFTSAYSIELAYMTNAGNSTIKNFFFNVGKGIGMLYTLPLQAVAGAYRVASKAIDFITNTPSNKFYYMEPKMAQYFQMLTYLVNQTAVNMGVTEPLDDALIKTEDGKVKIMEPSEPLAVAQYLPDIFKGAQGGAGGGIDVYAVASKFQRVSQRYRRELQRITDKTLSSSSRGEFDKSMTEALKSINVDDLYNDDREVNLATLLNRYHNKIKQKEPIASSEVAVKDAPGTPAEGVIIDTGGNIQNKGISDPDLIDVFRAELADGGQFITFAVDANPEVSESFSNSSSSSELEDSLNSSAELARRANFNFAGGNLGDNVFANTVEAAMDAIGALLNGLLSAVSLGGLASLNGSSQFDIQDMWDGHDATMPTASFTITLGGPYNDPMSVLIDQVIPLLMLVTGAIPRSTGHNTYTSPFMCRAFSKGRFDIKNGMISSLNIRRFVANRPQSVEGLSTRIVVDVEVANFDKLIHAPMETSILAAAGMPFAMQDTAIGDYLGALSAMDLYDIIYLKPRAKRAAQVMSLTYRDIVSPNAAAAIFADTMPGRLITGFATNADI